MDRLTPSSRTILVVDRSDVDRMAVRRHLPNDRVLESDSGRGGLKAFERESVDCVLLSNDLTDGDGLSLLDRLADEGATVVMLATQVEEEVIVQALERGAQDYLVKDALTAKSVQQAVSHAIERQALERTVRRQRDSLRESEQRLGVVYDSGSVGLCVSDAAGTIIDSNPFFAELLGYTCEEIVGENVLELTHPDDRQAVVRALEKCRDPGRRPIQLERRFRTRHQETTWTLAVVGWTFNDDDQPLHRTTLVLDISERKRLEQQFRQAQKMEAVGRLAGGIAHDFNNLLTVIQSFTQFALEGLAPDDASHEDLSEVLRAAERAETLTEQLLAFSRQQTIDPHPANINDLVGSIDKMLRRILGEDIDYLTVLQASLWAAYIDPGAFEQVLLNLAVNARDAMPNGGKLTIETGNVVLDRTFGAKHGAAIESGDYVSVSVSDSGVGMSADVQGRAFEPFYTTKGPGEGTGLGLATCYGIVKQAGGYIWVYSEPDQGTTFRIYVPRCRADAESQLRGEEPERDCHGDETILVAEDEDAVRTLTARALRNHGYTVLEALDGQEALQVACDNAGQIDLLLTDVVMPNMSGKQLAALFRARNPHSAVLYMSGYTANAIAHRGLLEPSTQLVQKPFTPERLVRRVRETLDDHREVQVLPDHLLFALRR